MDIPSELSRAPHDVGELSGGTIQDLFTGSPLQRHLVQATLLIGLPHRTIYPSAPTASTAPTACSAFPPFLSYYVVQPLYATASDADGSTCSLGAWLGLTVLGPASLSAEKRGVIQLPGLLPASGGRLQPLSLPLAQDYWDGKPKGRLQDNSGLQQVGTRLRQEQQGNAERALQQQKYGFPSLAESSAKKKQGQPESAVPSPQQLKRRSGGGSGQEAATARCEDNIMRAGDRSKEDDGDQDLRMALLASWPGSLEHVPATFLMGPAPVAPLLGARINASSTTGVDPSPAALAADAAEAAVAALRARTGGAARVAGGTPTPGKKGTAQPATPTSISAYIAIECVI